MTTRRRSRPSVREFGRFVIVGGLAFGVDLLVLSVGTRMLGADPYTARVASFLVAATVAWFLHRHVTFRNRGFRAAWVTEWATFLSANAIGFAVNAGVYVGVLIIIPSASPEFALAIASAVALAVNFAINTLVTFR